MKTSLVHPYLFFGGRCEEALAFYATAVGAKVDLLMRFNESPQPLAPGQLPPGFETKVMHATFHIGDSTLQASDGDDPALKFSGFSLSLTLPTAAEVDRAFAALAEGGTVKLPPAKTFWSPRFGMLTDRFGIGWMIGAAT